jgi:hypothetical protein
MGIWARDKADQEDRSAGEGYRSGPHTPPAVFTCDECGRSFASASELANHCFDGHITRRPRLLLGGRELDRARRLVAEPSNAIDWDVLDAREVVLNGDRVSPQALAERLAGTTTGVSTIVLTGNRTETAYELRFTLADPDELDAIDDAFMRLAFGERLTVTAVGRLIDEGRRHPTVGDYVGGLTDYLFGVLARDGAADSGIGPTRYHEKYDAAAAALSPFRRTVADTVVGLITFHFNQLDEARTRSNGHRVASAALRLQAIEQGHDSDAIMSIEPVTSSDLEFVISDDHTEQVLRWCCLPFDDMDDQTLHEIEAGIGRHVPYDRRKLHLIAAEARIRRGDVSEARHHINELRQQSIDDRWVTGALDRLHLLQGSP